MRRLFVGSSFLLYDHFWRGNADLVDKASKNLSSIVQQSLPCFHMFCDRITVFKSNLMEKDKKIISFHVFFLSPSFDSRMSSNYVLGIDFGTRSCRACVMNEDTSKIIYDDHGNRLYAKTPNIAILRSLACPPASTTTMKR